MRGGILGRARARSQKPSKAVRGILWVRVPRRHPLLLKDKVCQGLQKLPRQRRPRLDRRGACPCRNSAWLVGRGRYVDHTKNRVIGLSVPRLRSPANCAPDRGLCLPAAEATTPAIRKTALNAVHRQMGAKMVDFNGGTCPWSIRLRAALWPSTWRYAQARAFLTSATWGIFGLPDRGRSTRCSTFP